MMKLAERNEGQLVYRALEKLTEYEQLLETIAMDLKVPTERVEKLILNLKRRQ